MGRYYNGDIEGKFAFGVQSSTAADRFGVEGQYTKAEYYFMDGDIPLVVKELNKIEDSFSVEKRNALLAYFDLYTLEKIAPMSFDTYLEEGGVERLNSNEAAEYVDYRLGREILECIKENGECCFSAEL
tara:strand:- start:2781 stop:3167 length:387 start_codon:yes stop_codon:yes gene_type:complete